MSKQITASIAQSHVSAMSMVSFLGWADLMHQNGKAVLDQVNDNKYELMIGRQLADRFSMSANTTVSYLHVPRETESFLLFLPYKFATVTEDSTLILSVGMADADNSLVEIHIPVDSNYIDYLKNTPFLGLSGSFDTEYATYERTIMLKKPEVEV